MDNIALSVVIPVFNEEENVQPLHEELDRALRQFPGGVEFVFVDDDSRDRTFELLKRAQESDCRIRIVHFRSHQGQTAAIAAGFRFALGAAIVTIDGDLQNDPSDIPRLVEMLRDWDVACGVRVRRRDTGWKRLSSRIANGFRNWATDDDIVDTGCTLKAYRRECVEKLELYNGMHRFLPTLLKMRGYLVTQIPVNHRPRLRGTTKYGTLGRLVKGLNDVWAVRWMQKNQLHYGSVVEVVEHHYPPPQAAGEPTANRARSF